MLRLHGTVTEYRIRSINAEKIAVNGSVTNQASTILRNNFKSTSLVLLVRAQPTNTTDPTLQWVVLIGKPNLEAIKTVVADPISIVKPLKKRIKVRVTRLENMLVLQNSKCNNIEKKYLILQTTQNKILQMFLENLNEYRTSISGIKL
ncbi:hypothetical protein TNCT_208501 [Trichonephila clavata]|uniref:Uncharacterized protein n=1 Tax=Trichonephila clavata TaxID=2740835 RepID=A0A8X6LVU7_TRICU|nr:hypothetical protein TNCT_208501 [Trichonephila clavata]